MTKSPKLSDWFALGVLTLMWGTAFLIQEIALRSYSPAVIATGRITFAAAVLWICAKALGASLPTSWQRWRQLALIALLGTAIPFNLIAWGQQHIESALAGILMAVMPLYVLTLAHFFVPGEKLTSWRVLGFGFGFAGVAVVIGPEAIVGSADKSRIWGMLAVLGAGLGYASSSIYARRISSDNPVAQAAAMSITASLICIPILASDVTSVQFEIHPAGVAAIACLGALSTGLASVLYFHLVQGPGPTFLSFVSYLIPVCAVIAGSLVLDEVLAPRVYWGMVLILLGIAASEVGPGIVRLVRSRLPHA